MVPAELAGVPITIEAAAEAAAGRVVVEHKTTSPYEATFEVASGQGNPTTPHPLVRQDSISPVELSDQ